MSIDEMEVYLREAHSSLTALAVITPTMNATIPLHRLLKQYVAS